MPLRCQCGSLRLSQEPTIIFGPELLSKFLWCPHEQRVVPVRGSCDQPAMYLQATSLRFFKICHSAELRKIVEATMSVNPYDNEWVSLQWPN